MMVGARQWLFLVLGAGLLAIPAEHGYRTAGAAAAGESWPAIARGVDEPLEVHQQLVDGLRQRGLFDLADRYCREQLQVPALTAELEATLIIELMKTQMARAMTTQGSGAQRAAWHQARQIGDDFLTSQPEFVRGELVRTQQVLSGLAEVRQLTQELALRAGPPESHQVAVERLRAARMQIEQLQRDLARQLPHAPRRSTPAGPLSHDELRALSNHLRFHLAQCHLLHAELAGEDDVARLDALHVALESLDDVLRQVDASNVLWWSTELARTSALRLMGQLERAVDVFSQLVVERVPTAVAAEYWTERLELACAGYESREMLQWWSDHGSRWTRQPRVELAALRLILVLAQRETEGRSELLAAAAELTRQIESRHGVNWGRLAEMHLVGGAVARADHPAASGDGSLEILMRTGDAAAREQRWDDALAAYRRGLDAALGGEVNWQMAFTLQLKISSALEQQHHFVQSAEELTSLSLRQSEHPLADTLHLRAAWCWAQAAGKEPALQTTYERVLTEHLARWPSRPSSDQARLWLARLRLAAGRFREAVDGFCSVAPASPHAVAAARELSAAVLGYLNQLAADDPRGLDREAHRLHAELTRLRQVGRAGGHAGETTATWYWLLAANRIGMKYRTALPEAMERELAVALGTLSDGDDNPLRAMARAQLLALRSRLGIPREELQTLWEAIRDDTAALWECRTALEALEGAAPAEIVVGLQLDVLASLLASESDEERQLPLRIKQAQLWLRQQRIDDAVHALRQLIERFPRRLDLQRELGLALNASPDARPAALAQWRTVAAGVKEHTEPWYEAKYHVARLLLESGEPAQARQMLEYLRAVPPGWSQSPWKDDFEALLIRCRQSL